MEQGTSTRGTAVPGTKPVVTLTQPAPTIKACIHAGFKAGRDNGAPGNLEGASRRLPATDIEPGRLCARREACRCTVHESLHVKVQGLGLSQLRH